MEISRDVLALGAQRVNRRRLLRITALASVGLLAACGGAAASPTTPTAAPQAPAATAAAPAASAPTSAPAAAAAPTAQPAATTVTSPAAQATTAPAASGAESWTTGKVATSSTAAFHIVSWEGTGKIEKWNLAIDPFFSTYYPKMNVQKDFGIPWDQYWTKLQTELAGGASPDFVWMHDTRSPTFSNLGLLQPLDAYLKQTPMMGWPDHYYPTQVQAFAYQGKQYALPYDWAPGAFYVNADLFKKAGVNLPTETTTFDDLVGIAKKLSNASGDPKTSQWGVVLPTADSSTDWIVRCFGGNEFTNGPVTPHFDDPNTIAAYQYLYDLMYKYKVMPTPQDMSALGGGGSALFASGKLAMYYGLNDGANSLAKAVGGSFTLTTAPTPKGPNKRVQFVGGSSFAIPKGSRQPDVAYELMRWIVSNPALLPKIGSDPSGGTFVSNLDYWKDGLPPASTKIPPDAYQHSFYELGKQDGVEPDYFVGFLQWDPDVYNKLTGPLWSGQETDVKKIFTQVQQQTVALLQAQGSR